MDVYWGLYKVKILFKKIKLKRFQVQSGINYTKIQKPNHKMIKVNLFLIDEGPTCSHFQEKYASVIVKGSSITFNEFDCILFFFFFCMRFFLFHVLHITIFFNLIIGIHDAKHNTSHFSYPGVIYSMVESQVYIYMAYGVHCAWWIPGI